MPQGTWLIDAKVAVQIYDCAGLLCGRVVWLARPRNAAGRLDADKNNPVPALRGQLVCGLTILKGLQEAAAGHWRNGRFYNPDDGRSYDVIAALRSPDVIVARIYLGLPLFGETKIMRRIPRSSSAGWC